MEDEDIKIVKELLKEFKTYNDLDGIQDLRLYIKAIENLLGRLKTANKMIELMAEFMNKRSWKEHQVKDENCYCCKIEYGSDECKECIIEYFKTKAKESENNE